MLLLGDQHCKTHKTFPFLEWIEHNFVAWKCKEYGVRKIQSVAENKNLYRLLSIKLGHSLPLYSCIFNTVVHKICRWLDSNRGPLLSVATALPREPRRGYLINKFLFHQFHCKSCSKLFLRKVQVLARIHIFLLTLEHLLTFTQCGQIWQKIATLAKF